MSKQDGCAPRTAADLERKYNFGQTFADVYGLAADARKIAEEAQNAYQGLNQDQIFNLLTNFGQAQGIYRDDTGNVYVNASYIKGGKVAADYIDTENLKVEAANITGGLTVGDDSTELNSLGNHVVNIIKGTVTADYIKAIGLIATYVASESDGNSILIADGKITVNNSGYISGDANGDIRIHTQDVLRIYSEDRLHITSNTGSANIEAATDVDIEAAIDVNVEAARDVNVKAGASLVFKSVSAMRFEFKDGYWELTEDGMAFYDDDDELVREFRVTEY